MRIDSCFELGHVIKIHGIKGEVLVFIDADDPLRYNDLESVFVEIKHKLIPFFIEGININGHDAIIKFEEVESIEQARKLLKSRLFLPLKILPDLGNDDFYFHEIIGYEVIDINTGKLGSIKSIYEANGNNLISTIHKGKEILIPLNKCLITRLDKEKREIIMDLPEGLIDIYLNP
jgi:16S rRNA processing protein RimM